MQEYLLKPEKLSIHKWERSQTHWHREANIDSLFLLDDDEFRPETTLEVIYTFDHSISLIKKTVQEKPYI